MRFAEMGYVLVRTGSPFGPATTHGRGGTRHGWHICRDEPIPNRRFRLSRRGTGSGSCTGGRRRSRDSPGRRVAALHRKTPHDADGLKRLVHAAKGLISSFPRFRYPSAG